MSPHFLDLSTELVIQILAYASLHDIGACARTSRRLHDIISGSQYIRYLVLTKLAGMGDPFIPGLSIQERIAILERWERAWHDLDLRKPALQCVVPRDISVSVLRYQIHGGHLIGFRQFHVDDRPLGYSYADLHDVAKRGYVSWTNVDLRQSLFVFSYCFNVEEYNLAVMLVYNPEEHPEPAASLRVLDFSKGTDHPLATTPNILLRFRETTINIYDAHDAHMEVAGDNVVVMITQSRALSDYVFLVGWKSGSVSLIMTAPDLTYATSFSLIDTELLALVNLRMNTVEIHRVQHGPSCALQRFGQLSLPFPRTGNPALPASFQFARAHLPSCSSRPRYLPFRPSSDACLVGLTAIIPAQDGAMTFYWLAVRPDYLCSIADTQCNSDLPTSWEAWSAHAACCIEIEHPLAAPTPAGARWLAHSQSLVVRDFGPPRTREARADRRTHHDKAVAGGVFRPGFKDDFPSQLPYCDVAVNMGERKYESILADYEWVVGINQEGDDFSRLIHHIDIHHVV